MSWQQLSVLDKAYKDFKERKGKIDFIDMIERFIKTGTSPKFHMLIIDEAQDLAPIQWKKMVKDVLVPNSEHVYYAGDDDQAIYSWMGVDVKHFLNASHQKYY